MAPDNSPLPAFERIFAPRLTVDGGSRCSDWSFRFDSHFVGREVITKIPPTLHTPLMSGTNAISGITLVGALHLASSMGMSVGAVATFLAIVLAAINVVGGFLVTDRMLKMFRKPR